VSIAAELIQIRRLLETGGDAFETRQARPEWMPVTSTACSLSSP